MQEGVHMHTHTRAHTHTHTHTRKHALGNHRESTLYIQTAKWKAAGSRFLGQREYNLTFAKHSKV
eukprot:1912131-Amphidinium_carterae.2